MNFTVDEIRNQFPILERSVNDKPLVYFDNAATTQKPIEVIDEIKRYYEEQNANIHRGVHHLSQISTVSYENVRKRVAQFINASSERETIFTRGTTESINLVASSFGKKWLRPGDEIILTTMEHHSNIVPWQLNANGAKILVIPVTAKGELDISVLNKLISKRTKIIAVGHISNALGTINPIEEIIATARKHDIKVLVDGAQAVPHVKVDVQALDADFYCFSGHKMYGPMGIGVLFGKEELMKEMPPWQGGGEMIDKVSFEGTTYNELPYKFEAGTPNVGDALALGKAIDFMEKIGFPALVKHEDELLEYATEQLMTIDNMNIVGQPEKKAGVISFNIDKVHHYDTGMILDKLGIAVRTGHHCAQPLMDHFGIPGTIRASFAVYNTKKEVDTLVEGIHTALSMLL